METLKSEERDEKRTEKLEGIKISTRIEALNEVKKKWI